MAARSASGTYPLPHSARASTYPTDTRWPSIRAASIPMTASSVFLVMTHWSESPRSQPSMHVRRNASISSIERCGRQIR